MVVKCKYGHPFGALLKPGGWIQVFSSSCKIRSLCFFSLLIVDHGLPRCSLWLASSAFIWSFWLCAMTISRWASSLAMRASFTCAFSSLSMLGLLARELRSSLNFLIFVVILWCLFPLTFLTSVIISSLNPFHKVWGFSMSCGVFQVLRFSKFNLSFRPLSLTCASNCILLNTWGHHVHLPFPMKSAFLAIMRLWSVGTGVINVFHSTI